MNHWAHSMPSCAERCRSSYVRPERLGLVPPADGQVRAQVDHVVFAGAATHLHLRVGEHELQAVVPNDGSSLVAVEGGEVGLLLKPDALRVLAD